MREKKLKIYVDGSSYGNPGPSGIGVIIYDHREHLIYSTGEFIGQATNNEAEYRALIHALIEALILSAKELFVHLDSELVANQVSGRYKVKNPRLMQLHQEVCHLMRGFDRVTVRCIERTKNRDADRLAQKAIKLRSKR